MLITFSHCHNISTPSRKDSRRHLLFVCLLFVSTIPLSEEMLGNCEKMLVISSTTNEWPQNQIDENNLMASTGRLMEKPLPGQEQQQPLKCPRCDSSNTKFCYYNNYSLSQPRHFCKACKRYWTRGGTLRNVPVGGGCRKNKRVKRPASSTDGASSTPNANLNNTPTQTQLDISSTSNHINPLIYGLPTNPSEINLPFSRFNSRVSSVDTVSGYDINPQLNAHGLGFSPTIMSSDAGDGNYRNGFNHTKQIQDVVTSNSLISSYSTFGSSSSFTTTSPTISSLLASSLNQHKYINGGVKSITQVPNHFSTLTSLEDLQMTANGGARIAMKEMKAEEGLNRMDWNVSCQNQMEQIGLSDPSLYWNTTSVGAWHDPTNIGSSVTSLI